MAPNSTDTNIHDHSGDMNTGLDVVTAMREAGVHGSLLPRLLLVKDVLPGKNCIETNFDCAFFLIHSACFNAKIEFKISKITNL